MKKVFLTAIILSYISNILIAQVTFTASANKVVEIGENFRLNFKVNANASGFVPPNLSNFSVLAGPGTQTNSSYEYDVVTGKTTQKFTITYSYIIQAHKEGNL